MTKAVQHFENQLKGNSLDDANVFKFMELSKNGLSFAIFKHVQQTSSFPIEEWASILHLSERTLQRYKTDNKTFDTIYAERIIQIALLYEQGSEVFGSKEKFSAWMESESLVLGNQKPRHLLVSSFGIGLLQDELLRIEHGVLA